MAVPGTTSGDQLQNSPNSITKWFVRLWNYLINTGISPETSLWNKKRIRLLNGISVTAFIAHCWFVFTYTSAAFRIVFWESFQSACFYLLILLLNKWQKFNLTCHLFCIYNILCYSYFAITHGKVDAAEYILLASGMASMLLFKEVQTIFSYLFLNFLFFWICKYSFVVMKPIFVLPEDIYIPNHIFLFLVCYLIVAYFKTENFRQEEQLNTQNLILFEEKAKSEKLLLNILPQETADELKTTGSAKPKYFEQVSVMFTDFHNFTQIAAQMSPEELVEEINFCFSSFDSIVDRYGVEKIKTIGDSYMCVGGLPLKNGTHAQDAVLAGMEMLEFMNKRKDEKMATDLPFFEIRIGIHSGAVVAGVVGTKKFAYDIWGDTVNIASRMESSGEEGKINISQATFLLIKDNFKCFYRGRIDAKHRGMIDMYFVNEKQASI